MADKTLTNADKIAMLQSALRCTDGNYLSYHFDKY